MLLYGSKKTRIIHGMWKEPDETLRDGRATNFNGAGFTDCWALSSYGVTVTPPPLPRLGLNSLPRLLLTSVLSGGMILGEPSVSLGRALSIDGYENIEGIADLFATIKLSGGDGHSRTSHNLPHTTMDIVNRAEDSHLILRDNVSLMDVDDAQTGQETRDNVSLMDVDDAQTGQETRDNISLMDVDNVQTSQETHRVTKPRRFRPGTVALREIRSQLKDLALALARCLQGECS
ncbi:hypothetical protein C8R48DRAFT_680391 [Suillus tomentosus]|nr:hypothetical protein C8R48DRAFT_680391 [Suillus tomentosus]